MKPKVFIASSKHSKMVAEFLKKGLERDCLITTWYEDAFKPSQNFLTDLEICSNNVNFAILIATPDDTVQKFNSSKKIRKARDNVIFESGLFIGKLGRENCLFVTPQRSLPGLLPTDLDGISFFKFNDSFRRNKSITMSAALQPVVEKLHNYIQTRFSLSVTQSKIIGFSDDVYEPYKVGIKILSSRCKNIVLFQYSSSLILGPEVANKYEKEWLEKLFLEIPKCNNFYHVTSVEGCKEHYFSQVKRFPEIKEVQKILESRDGCLELSIADKLIFIKKIEDDGLNISNNFMLTPAFIVEHQDGNYEGVILGYQAEKRSCIHISGNVGKFLMDQCISLYNKCIYLMTDDISEIFLKIT